MSNHLFFRYLSSQLIIQSSWIKGISETKSKQQSPCSNCMHQPVMSWGNACSMCMPRSVTCTYCLGSKVSSLSQIYLYSSYFAYYWCCQQMSSNLNISWQTYFIKWGENITFIYFLYNVYGFDFYFQLYIYKEDWCC